MIESTDLTDIQLEFIESLRQKISDTRYVVDAFSIQCIDQNATASTVEFDGSRFLLTTEGGLNVDLEISVDNFPTLLSVVNEINLSAKNSFRAILAELAEAEHLSADCMVIPPTNILENGFAFRTRRFSNIELYHIGEAGVDRHNMGMDIENIPENERSFALTLSHAEVLYDMATDSTKRRGMDIDAKTLLDIAKRLDDTYIQDMKRLQLYESPTAIGTESANRSGDITVSQSYRRNLRYRGTPLNVVSVPKKPEQFQAKMIVDGSFRFIRLTWDRVKETLFRNLVIYRSSVSTPKLLMIITQHGGYKIEPRTASLMFSCSDPRITLVDDDTILPGMTYYYRLFVLNQNLEHAASDIVTVKTGVWA